VTINKDVIQFDCPRCGGGTWLLNPPPPEPPRPR
jgi:hypothetical protein